MGVFQVQGLKWRGLPDFMRDENQLLAGLIPAHGRMRRIVVLDADIDSHKKRVSTGDAQMMRMVDARIPHFAGDEYLFGGRPLILMQAQISPAEVWL